jgi:hypothetical protein
MWMGLLAAALGGAGVWWLTGRPAPLRWAPARAAEADRAWLGLLLGRLQRRWRNTLPEAQAALGLTPRMMALRYAVTAGAAAIILAQFLHLWPPLGLAAGIAIAYLAVPAHALWQYERYRRQVASNFGPLVLLLQFYLSLDYPIAEALKAALPAVGPFGRRELTRLLGELRLGSGPAAFRASAERITQLHWGVLMDTLAQAWGHSTGPGVLEPLTQMLRAQRDEQALLLTSAVDAVSTAVPLLAVFGGLIGFLLFLFAGAGVTL